MSGMGQRKHARVQTEPTLQDFGVAAPLRGIVVEEHHPLAQHHGSSGPGEDRPSAHQGRDAEEAQPVQQHGDVPARYRKGSAALQQLFELASVPSHDGAFQGPERRLEIPVGPPYPAQVVAIERPHRRDRRTAVGGDHCPFATPLLESAGCIEGVPEAQSVDLLEAAQLLLTTTVGPGKLWIGSQHLLGPVVEAQVDHPSAQVLPELVDLLFAFLPPGSDDGDGPGDPGPLHRIGEKGTEPLGP
jgi:hypothetical protein